MRWGWVAGAAVLGALAWWVGTEPFVSGLRALDAETLALGAALGVPVTVAAAWRWRLVARGLGVELPLRRATAACYRAQLLNSVLPGGVLGDVHRALDHGRGIDDVSRGLRSVAWERTLGQLVQGAVAVLVLVVLPSPVRASLPGLLTVLVVALVVLGVLAHGWSTLRTDLAGLRDRRVWPGVVASSVVVVAGLVTTYVVAARAVGVSAPLASLVPLAILVLVAAAVPANLAGWGPREGMAAWAFAAAGLGAEQGLATSVAFGVMVVVAVLPGAVVLLVGAWRPAVASTQETEVRSGA
ncbi:lysylphosphatidylglycerol synthase domain-containing protein [Nocardioides sp.]|uniref:lysylphosphatidylglycerol synthase domain-containing protein n=1 Tax=Nocardioides sp. TaxID=35761 RepID=UPI002ED62CB6